MAKCDQEQNKHYPIQSEKLMNDQDTMKNGQVMTKARHMRTKDMRGLASSHSAFVDAATWIGIFFVFETLFHVVSGRIFLQSHRWLPASAQMIAGRIEAARCSCSHIHQQQSRFKAVFIFLVWLLPLIACFRDF